MAGPPLSLNAWLRYDLVQQLLEGCPPGSSFLEVGCGMGGLGSRLAARYEYIGYEPDLQSYEIARARLGGRGVVINGVLPERPTRSFDVLGAFEVLEHIREDHATLRAWREWIRPGGGIICSVPANPNRYGAADAAVGHYRRYDRPDLFRLLSRCGFDDITIWSYGFPLGHLLESARNVLARGAFDHTDTAERRTAASGRFHQPGPRLGSLTRLASFPFRVLQRSFRCTSLGTGLIAIARRSA